MARTEIVNGGTINIISTLSTSQISDFDNIIVEAYTSKTNPVRFSLVEKPGHSPIIEQSATQFKIKLVSAKTKLMKGDLFIEIKAYKDDNVYLLEDNGVGRTDTNITLID